MTCRKTSTFLSLLLLLALVAIAGCKSKAPSAGANSAVAPASTRLPLAKDRVLMIIAPGNFNDTELAKPKEIFAAFGAKVEVASTVKTELTGMHGLKIRPGLTLAEVDLDRYDAVVFIGGVGVKVYFDDPQVQQLARDAVAKNKLVGAICLAPSILARAGLLKGLNATVWSSEQDTLTSHGAKYLGPGVVDANWIITASGPKYAEIFAQQLVAALKQRAGLVKPNTE